MANCNRENMKSSSDEEKVLDWQFWIRLALCLLNPKDGKVAPAEFELRSQKSEQFFFY